MFEHIWLRSFALEMIENEKKRPSRIYNAIHHIHSYNAKYLVLNCCFFLSSNVGILGVSEQETVAQKR